jgi:hypothetical protein
LCSDVAQQQREKSEAWYSIPGRQELDEQLGVSLRTISRSRARFKRLDSLDPPPTLAGAGRWQTNLYKIHYWPGWRLGQRGELLRQPRHRETRTARNAFRTRKLPPSAPLSLQKNATGEEILARWKTRWFFPT